MRSGRLNDASGYGHLPLGPARVVQCSGHPCGYYISTSRPTSTTCAGGTPKYEAGRLALRCIMANRDFLQPAMPVASLLWNHHHPSEIIGDVLRIDAAKFRLLAGALQPLHHVRCFHEAEMQEDAGGASQRHAVNRALACATSVVHSSIAMPPSGMKRRIRSRH